MVLGQSVGKERGRGRECVIPKEETLSEGSNFFHHRMNGPFVGDSCSGTQDTTPPERLKEGGRT